MPVNDLNKKPVGGMEAMEDDELDLVNGGQQFVFRGESFQRDSWFVNFLTKLLIQGRIRRELDRPLDTEPQEVFVEGRRFRVWQAGGTVYVEEAV